MEIIEYVIEEYEFKKAMRENVMKNIEPLLLKNGFNQYGTYKYVRERNMLAQIITFRFSKDVMKVYAMLIPIFVKGDNWLEYGIEITGSTGHGLLNGKYFTTVYEPEKHNREIQYKNYKEKHSYSLNKIFYSLQEGIIPEMDEVNSIHNFVARLKNASTSFFGNKYLNAYRNGTLYKYIIGIYKCLYENFEEGSREVLELIKVNCTDQILYECRDKINLSCKEEFLISFWEICDERRRQYKLQNKK